MTVSSLQYCAQPGHNAFGSESRNEVQAGKWPYCCSYPLSRARSEATKETHSLIGEARWRWPSARRECLPPSWLQPATRDGSPTTRALPLSPHRSSAHGPRSPPRRRLHPRAPRAFARSAARRTSRRPGPDGIRYLHGVPPLGSVNLRSKLARKVVKSVRGPTIERGR
jgi:hypothetical protein